jgi:hypothetical protein
MKRLEMMEVSVAKMRREIEMKRRRWKMEDGKMLYPVCFIGVDFGLILKERLERKSSGRKHHGRDVS